MSIDRDVSPYNGAPPPSLDQHDCSYLWAFRGLAVLLGSGIVFFITVAEALLMTDQPLSDPQFRGIREANLGLKWGTMVAAIVWCTTFFPRLSCRSRLIAICTCAGLLCMTASFWFAWALFRYNVTLGDAWHLVTDHLATSLRTSRGVGPNR